MGLEKTRRVEEPSGEFKAVSAVHVLRAELGYWWVGWNGANSREEGPQKEEGRILQFSFA